MPQYDESFLDSPLFRRRARSYCVQKRASMRKSSSSFQLSASPLLLAITSPTRRLKTSASICNMELGNILLPHVNRPINPLSLFKSSFPLHLKLIPFKILTQNVNFATKWCIYQIMILVFYYFTINHDYYFLLQVRFILSVHQPPQWVNKITNVKIQK